MGRLRRRGAGAGSRPAPSAEHCGLEGAELGHPREADEVATVGQLGMARRADQPAVLRPVEGTVQEVIKLRAGCRLAGFGEDRLTAAAGALALEGRGRHCSNDGGL